MLLLAFNPGFPWVNINRLSNNPAQVTNANPKFPVEFFTMPILRLHVHAFYRENLSILLHGYRRSVNVLVKCV